MALSRQRGLLKQRLRDDAGNAANCKTVVPVKIGNVGVKYK